MEITSTDTSILGGLRETRQEGQVFNRRTVFGYEPDGKLGLGCMCASRKRATRT